MSPLILRYFPPSSAVDGAVRATYRIATAQLLRANGQTLQQVVIDLDAEGHLHRVAPLTAETAATVWHRGALRELPNGEIVMASSIVSPSSHCQS